MSQNNARRERSPGTGIWSKKPSCIGSRSVLYYEEIAEVAKFEKVKMENFYSS
jgi:hypothetical protein